MARLDMIVQTQNKRCLVYVVVEKFNANLSLPIYVSVCTARYIMRFILLLIKSSHYHHTHTSTIYSVYRYILCATTFMLSYLFLFFNSMTVSSYSRVKKSVFYKSWSSRQPMDFDDKFIISVRVWIVAIQISKLLYQVFITRHKNNIEFIQKRVVEPNQNC